MIQRALLPIVAVIALGTAALAGDILRGGATADPARRNATARANSGAEAAAIARRTADDRLARTTRVIESLRHPNISSGNSAIPNGLVAGGLVVANPASWIGAQLPTQNGSVVSVVQTAATARLFWESFNIGRTTTLRFDQSAGGTDIGKWIAFNHIVGNGQTRIAGTLIAPGQAYVENPNGITFESGSKISARTLVATTLPINNNLINQGLLNNRDAQFLFSGLEVPGGSDGTPAFVPPPPPASGRFGDITVQAGALLSSGAGSDGGRIMLVGANVTNNGVIESPSGQTILAAGLQVGIQAHNQNDPSLRGLDVWVGAVGDYAGTVTNKGLIESRTGSITIVGRQIIQAGALESSTSVNLNGRIDLIASYGSVGNPGFDNSTSDGFLAAPFISQFTGPILLGSSSVIRVVPDLSTARTVPGSSLPERSQVNLLGQVVRFGENSILLATSGKVSIRAGVWQYFDTNANRLADEPFLRTILFRSANNRIPDADFLGYSSSLLYSTGQVYFDAGSLLDVSGSTYGSVPLSNYVLEVQLRGPELSDSPLLRNTFLRGQSLTVDLRRTGNYGGARWIGTPLGDLNGIANIIERDVAQLTSNGGDVTINAGNSVIVASGATIDASGGVLNYEGGSIQTTRLLRNGSLVPVHQAKPDVTYDGIFEGTTTFNSSKWGISRQFAIPLAPLGTYIEQPHIGGANGGSISITAPGVLVAGDLLGKTINGPRQLDSPPEGGSLNISFRNERLITLPAGNPVVLFNSPNSPSIEVRNTFVPASIPGFVLAGDGASEISGGATNLFTISSHIYDEDQWGFAHLSLQSEDGDFSISRGVSLEIAPRGSLEVESRNVALQGNIEAPGGTISFTAFNFSPYLYAFLEATGALVGLPAPAPVPGRGLIEVASTARLISSGLIVDDRPTAPKAFLRDRAIDGGGIYLEGYSVSLARGSLLDASGGVLATAHGDFEYGDGGDISLLAGRDPNLETTIGGFLDLQGRVQAYGGRVGGSLTLRSTFIQIGGGGAPEDTLFLSPSFFQQGGFEDFNLAAIGGRTTSGQMRPAIRVVAGTVIEPRVDNYVLSPYGGPGGQLAWRPYLKPVGIRPAANLSLSARGVDDPFVAPGETGVLEALGLIVLEDNTRITTDPGGSVSVDGDSVNVLGTIDAPGGTISLIGRSSFRLPVDLSAGATFALPTVYLGPNARLLARGTTVLLPDPYGRRSGIIYPGGTISVSGNILAASGSVLDVSGASAVLDFHPSRLGRTGLPLVAGNTGLNTTPWQRQFTPVRVDSDGGTIELRGSQFLYSDAELLGNAGGPTALGGTLVVSSERFYSPDELQKGSDINLIVQQNGNAAAFGGFTNSQAIFGALYGPNFESNVSAAFTAGKTNPGIGFFAIEQFVAGGFDSLDLGFYFVNSSPRFGGNVEFRGPVTINARGFVRVAGGGVIRADSNVSITAPYIAIGQEFRPPLNPSDTQESAPVFPFEEETTSGVGQQLFPPEPGPGTLTLNAQLIDVGTLTLLGISEARFNAPGGDIRGSGTVSIAGDITFTSAQLYPTTLAAFDIFAYPFPGGGGTVEIIGSGQRALPLSAGGVLRIYAEEIVQGGTIVAPLGSIVLGWDGVDTDPSDPDIDPPFNPAVGGTLPVPVAQTVLLKSGSRTSVSSIDALTGQEIVVPFGLSPDGLSWIDPRGVNVTVSGLPARGVYLSGDSITTEVGSVVDIRGGGDLLAYRWVAGNNGSADLLGLSSSLWSSTANYSSGDLVLFEGETYSARVNIDPENFVSSPEPEPGRFWRLVPESYAILPGFGSNFAPYNSFSTSVNASNLGGDPGYISGNLRLGQQIYLEQNPYLNAGTYTLLPRRYAIYPGSYLVIPQEGRLTGSASPINTTLPALGSTTHPIGTAVREEGSAFVSGYTFNSFNTPRRNVGIYSRFEVVPPDVLEGRAEYERYFATSFIPEAAERLGLEAVQALPNDAGYLAIQGNSSLILAGSVLTAPSGQGRGAAIDISSFNDIYILGGTGTAPGTGEVVLDANLIQGWGAESLIIGGIRRTLSDGTAAVSVRSNNVTLDNPGSTLSGPDILLVSKEALSLTPGSSLAASGSLTQPAKDFFITGDGVLVRVSGDAGANVFRSGLAGSTLPLLTVGAGAAISGSTVILDSTYASSVDPTIAILADTLRLRGGQISIQFSPNPLTGSVVNPHLVLSGDFLANAQQSSVIELLSYRTIDIYGDGVFGSDTVQSLSLLGAGIRGFARGADGVEFLADEVILGNPNNTANLGAPDEIPPAGADPVTGNLLVNSKILRFGANTFSVQGYSDLALNASGGAIAESSGTLSTSGNLNISTPLITGSSAVNYNVLATGSMSLQDSGGVAQVDPGLGASLLFQATAIQAGSNVLLPGGLLTLTALTGDLNVSGSLDVSGAERTFQDVTRFIDAGEIRLTSRLGNVNLSAGSLLSVAGRLDGGSAGRIVVEVPNGIFSADGEFQGAAKTGEVGGSFFLDAGSLSSFTDLRDLLSVGGFRELWNLRLRTGDVTVSGSSVVRNFVLSADAGSILVDGTIDSSGETGGSISLLAREDVTLQNGAFLSVRGENFSNAGKGGSVRLEAGAVNLLIDPTGSPNLGGMVTIGAGSTIDLGVDDFIAGSYQTPGTSAFNGQFTGKLSIRAPRNGMNLNVAAIQGNIISPSAVLVEAFRTYVPAGGNLNAAARNTMNTDNAAYLTAANDNLLRAALLAGSVDPAGLAQALVITPGVEFINPTGNLVLGSAGNFQGTNPADDWNLATFRYGSEAAPGVLTFRAAGDIIFQNALSDGFAGFTSAQGVPPAGRQLWLANLMAVNGNLPLNSQSWSYRITSGADLASADFRQVRPVESLASNVGSIRLGNFYDNSNLGGTGTSATTANAISPTGATTRFQVIRTGTGDIELSSGRDIQLRNQFASIYTAGVAIPTPTQIFSPGDFVLPIVQRPAGGTHPNQDVLGTPQQVYPPQWGFGGGDLTISAQSNIQRISRVGLNEVIDSTRQLPNNWLYRRAHVDESTGLFAVGGVTAGLASTVNDPSASTTWWIDYSNFFQGLGALGGGNIAVSAGIDIVNVDGVVPTNARMAGLSAGTRIAPNDANLLEYGGGDLTVRAGNNISGGVYYVEKGQGVLRAGNEITTNQARTPSLYIISATPQIFDSRTWLPTSLFVGKSTFDVSARGNILLGPVTNPYLLPQGVNNKFWYKTYFQTYGEDSSVQVTSVGGDVTHRLETVLPGATASVNILQAWYQNQNVFAGSSGNSRAAFSQPWIRVAETSVQQFATAFSIAPASLFSTSIEGNVEVIGDLNLFPSPTGTVELVAGKGVIGLNPVGITRTGSPPVDVIGWTTASINLSDSDPASSPGKTNPLAYQNIVGRGQTQLVNSTGQFLQTVNQLFAETGSFTGANAAINVQRALHSQVPVHLGDTQPLRIYAGGGDVTGLTLFSAKTAQITAARDITDIAFYIQNVAADQVSIVSAGRDIIAYNENSELRSIASNLALGNVILDVSVPTALNTSSGTQILTNILPGDIQIGGPGYLEVLAGRNIDLGTGPNRLDGTGVGITSIGRARNPFLSAVGADILLLAGVGGSSDATALGLLNSVLNLESLLDSSGTGSMAEIQAIQAIASLFNILRQAGEDFEETGSYESALTAISEVFGATSGAGDIFTRARDIRTSSGGSITIAAPNGGLTMAPVIFGNPLTPPGIVTEFGGEISILTGGDIDIGQARIFTLRGGDLTLWSTTGDIAAGTAPKTVVTAPPTRVLFDSTSADLVTDLGGLATGGGIGVLASVEGVEAGNVILLAPEGTVDAGDAGIRSTGDITIAAAAVVNADNISAGGASTGVPAAPTVAAPNIAGLSSAGSSTGATTAAAESFANQAQPTPTPEEEEPSLIEVEVLGYGGGEG